MRLRMALMGALILILGSASVAAACGDTDRVRDPEARICLFGDPRALVTLDNSGSDVDVTYKVVYWTGSAGVRQVIKSTVPDGAVRTMKLWARGKTDVIVRDLLTGALLARITVTRANISPICPRLVLPA